MNYIYSETVTRRSQVKLFNHSKLWFPHLTFQDCCNNEKQHMKSHHHHAWHLAPNKWQRLLFYSTQLCDLYASDPSFPCFHCWQDVLSINLSFKQLPRFPVSKPNSQIMLHPSIINMYSFFQHRFSIFITLLSCIFNHLLFSSLSSFHKKKFPSINLPFTALSLHCLT